MKPHALVGAAFVVSRFIYRGLFGIRLDASPVYWFLQFLDPYFLETDLARSVLSLHHQAPLLNLLVGLCLKLFGSWAFVAVDVVFIALGLAAAIAMVDALLALGVSPRASTAAAAFYACTPVTVLYESWLFYPHVVTSLLIVAASLLLRFVRRRTIASGAAFFGVLAAVGLVRSTYGPLWFCVVAGALLALGPLPRKTILKAAAVPLVVLLLHSAKTPLYVGHGYGDAMLWPNLARKIYAKLPPRDARRLVADGRLSPAMKVEAFTPLGSTGIILPHEPTGVPALDMSYAPSGRLNANALEHVLVAEQYYKKDALYLLKRYPGTYAKASLEALTVGTMGSPAQDSTLVKSPNHARLSQFHEPMKAAALTRESGFSPVVAAVFVLGLASGVVAVVRGKQRDGAPKVLATFAVLTILYTVTVTSLVSWGDFPRYRFETDGLTWILAAFGAAALFRATVRRLRYGRDRLDASVGDRRGQDQREDLVERQEGDRSQDRA
ncbi:MAG: hypothetical protein HOW73_46790 [Polyangiaceae bacterium]|nr:hypothetical protein [Polyangiaceae bacterium]